MSTICNKCKHLWERLGKPYCMGTPGRNCKYSNSKKQCEHFEEGENVKKFKNKNNLWRKKER